MYSSYIDLLQIFTNNFCYFTWQVNPFDDCHVNKLMWAYVYSTYDTVHWAEWEVYTII